MEDLGKILTEKYKDIKVCVCWPSPEKTDYRFNHDMLQFCTRNSNFVKIGVANRVSSRIAVNRNLLVEDARRQKATHIMWIDADTKFPENGLIRLLSYDKDIVCATTARRQGNDARPIGTPVPGVVEPVDGKLWPLLWVGLPFMLTKMSVFDKLDELFLAESNGRAKKGEMTYFAEPPRWMLPECNSNEDPLIGEDEYFCHYARKAGFDVYCDEEFSYEIGHVGSCIYYIQNNETFNPTKAKEAMVDESL